MNRSGQAATALLLAVAAAAGGWWWWLNSLQPPVDGPTVVTTARESAVAPTPTAGGAAATASAQDALPPEVVHEALRRWIREHSSLRGAQADGDWGTLDDQGRLQPSASVRRRFDQLLTLHGELTLDQLSLFVAQNASEALGPAGGAQVVEVWRRYLGLQGRPLATRVSLADPATWRQAQAERVAARRATLGPEWSAAFYAQDDAEFDALLRQAQNPPTASTTVASVLNPAELSPEQAQRLAAQRAAWADWQTRLTQAQREWRSLQSDPTLSDMQRRAALGAFIGPRFDAAEQRRVRALLGIQP